jgi:hypothetical protein
MRSRVITKIIAGLSALAVHTSASVDAFSSRSRKTLLPFLILVLTAATVPLTAHARTSGCLTDTTQADFQAGVATNCDLTSSPGEVTLLNAPAIDQQNTTLGTSGTGITTTTWGGQTFTPSVTGQMTQVDINLFCSGCTGTTPNLTLSLRATSGGLPTGADLASAAITGFGNGAAVFYTVIFNTPATLTAGTQYALVIRPTANPSPGTYALTRSGTATAGADVYPGGTRVVGSTSGTVWSIPLTGGVSTDAGFKIYMDTGFATSGTFVSSLKDANPPPNSNPTWSTLSWTATAPANTSLQFQVAASNNSSGPFNFVGPDGTSATFFTVSGASLSPQFDGNRYLKYKAYLATSDSTQTPTLSDVTVCYNNTIATHDFNGDGKSDIAWFDTSSNIAIWLMNGTTVTNYPTSLVGTVPGQWGIVGQRDFNGDSFADLLARDTNGNVSIWLMNGTTTLNQGSGLVANVPAQWSIVGTGDFNGDGKGDILWQDMSGNVAIWEMNGTTILNPNSAFVGNVASPWSIKGTGDFDGDGNADILWMDTSGNLAIWEMNGTMVLNASSSFVSTVPSQWSIVGTGDFNGDGMSDILWQDTSGNLAIWEMNGTAVLNASSSYFTTVAPQWSIQHLNAE